MTYVLYFKVEFLEALIYINVVKQDGARTGKQKHAAFVTDTRLKRVSNRDKGGGMHIGKKFRFVMVDMHSFKRK